MTVHGNVNDHNSYGKQSGGSLECRVAFSRMILQSHYWDSTYPKKMKSVCQTSHSHVHCNTIHSSQTTKQTNCLKGWIWNVINTVGCCWATRRTKPCHSWHMAEPEGIMLSEIGQMEKDKHRMISCVGIWVGLCVLDGRGVSPEAGEGSVNQHQVKLGNSKCCVCHWTAGWLQPTILHCVFQKS